MKPIDTTNLARHLREGTLLQGGFRRTDPDGVERACLLAALGEEVCVTLNPAASEIMPGWLRVLLVNMTDLLDREDYEALATEMVVLAPHWHRFTARTWIRAEELLCIELIAVLRDTYSPAARLVPALGPAFFDRAISIIKRPDDPPPPELPAELVPSAPLVGLVGWIVGAYKLGNTSAVGCGFGSIFEMVRDQFGVGPAKSFGRRFGRVLTHTLLLSHGHRTQGQMLDHVKGLLRHYGVGASAEQRSAIKRTSMAPIAEHPSWFRCF